MMLVSSSGWAHSPSTLSFTGLSIEYVADVIVLPEAAAIAAANPIAASTVKKRLTSLLPFDYAERAQDPGRRPLQALHSMSSANVFPRTGGIGDDLSVIRAGLPVVRA